MAHIELTTANAGGFISARKLPGHFPLASVYMYLANRLREERIARGNPDHRITVRAWRVTDAGTFIMPPVAEMSYAPGDDENLP